MERLTKRDIDGTAIAPEFADETYIMQDDHDKFTGYINSPIVERLAELEDKLESGLAFDLTDGRNTILVSREDNLGYPMIAISVTKEELKTLIDKGIVKLPF